MKKRLTQLDLVKSSFQSMKKSSFIEGVLLDFLSLLSVVLMLSIMINLLNLAAGPALPFISEMYDAKSSGNDMAFEEAALNYQPQIERFLLVATLGSLASYLLIIFIVSYLGSRAWHGAFDSKYWGPYFFLNIIWSFIWGFLLAIIAILIPPQISAIVLLLALLIFVIADPLMRAFFEKTRSIGHSLKMVLSNLSKFYMHAFYWAVCFLLFILVSILSQVFPWGLARSLFVLAGLAFIIGWGREYMKRFVRVAT